LTASPGSENYGVIQIWETIRGSRVLGSAQRRMKSESTEGWQSERGTKHITNQKDDQTNSCSDRKSHKSRPFGTVKVRLKEPRDFAKKSDRMNEQNSA
jgi:hypothetical protein